MNFLVYFAEDDRLRYGLNPFVIFKKTFEKLKIKYPNYYFEHKNTMDIRDDLIKKNIYKGPCNQYGDLFFRIENKENNKYFLVSYWDINRNIFEKESKSGFILEDLVELFTSCGIQKDEKGKYEICDPPIEYTPISYSHYLISAEKTVEQLIYKKIKKEIPEKPKFRGFCYGIRDYFLNDKRFNIIDTKNHKLSIEEYLEEINNNKINISFNGIGEISHRDIDILGLGNVLLRTKMITKFHNPLIPNYHYAAVEINDQSNYKTLSEAFLNKYNEIKKDKEYLEFLSCNARRWYLENGSSEKNSEIICNLINLKKL